jgi:hypothetical protein
MIGMKFTTRFGRTIEIPIEKYLSMTDDELSKLEEDEGTSIYFGDEFNTQFPNLNSDSDEIVIQED